MYSDIKINLLSLLAMFFRSHQIPTCLSHTFLSRLSFFKPFVWLFFYFQPLPLCLCNLISAWAGRTHSRVVSDAVRFSPNLLCHQRGSETFCRAEQSPAAMCCFVLFSIYLNPNIFFYLCVCVCVCTSFFSHTTTPAHRDKLFSDILNAGLMSIPSNLPSDCPLWFIRSSLLPSLEVAENIY